MGDKFKTHFKIYLLEDPLSCLERTPPEQLSYKELIMKKITSFHEKEMRVKAQGNELMQYMNVSLSGLRGHYHPSLSQVITTREVNELTSHMKFLKHIWKKVQRIRSGKYDLP